jgi:beta-glucanase (GH16 family)
VGRPSEDLTFAGPDGANPDTKVWSHEVGSHGWGNDELQAYTARRSNAHLDGAGNLRIVARHQDPKVSGAGTPRYSSARLSTEGKFEVQPGSYVEATVRAPFQQGVRAAFWLLGTDIASAGWPACGELDIMETTRSAATIRQAVHTSRIDDPKVDAPYGEFAPGGRTALKDSSESHRYGVYFDKDLVAFFVDGQERLRLTRDEAFEKNRSWPFNRPQSLRLAIAVDDEVPASRFPLSMEVSQISVWRGGVPLSLPGSSWP